MVVMTQPQKAVATELSARWGNAVARPLRTEGSVMIVGLRDDVELEFRAVAADGQRACWNCGGTSEVESRGGYGDLCEFCYDNILEAKR